MKKAYSITIDDAIDAIKIEGSKYAAAKRLHCHHYDVVKLLEEAGYSIDDILTKEERRAIIVKKRQATNLEKYGCKEPWNSDKQKQTNLERYGAENTFSSPVIKEKIAQQNLLRYGVENAAKSDEVKDRIKQSIERTNLERYGVKNAWQIEKVKDKVFTSRAKRFSKKELALKHVLSKYGFVHNDMKTFFMFGKTRKYPDYINEDKKLVLEFNGQYFHRNHVKAKYGMLEPNILELRYWYNNYTKYGYRLLVIQEKDFDDVLTSDLLFDDFVKKYAWKPKYDVYVAGPFFNQAQIDSMKSIEEILEKHNLTMFRPRLDAGQVDVKTASMKDLDLVFNNDVEGICNSNFILANLTYKDTGTSFEIGFAYGSHIPIILFNDTSVSGKKVNLMLATTSNANFNSLDDLDEYLTSGKINSYEMEIE